MFTATGFDRAQARSALAGWCTAAQKLASFEQTCTAVVDAVLTWRRIWYGPRAELTVDLNQVHALVRACDAAVPTVFGEPAAVVLADAQLAGGRLDATSWRCWVALVMALFPASSSASALAVLVPDDVAEQIRDSYTDAELERASKISTAPAVAQVAVSEGVERPHLLAVAEVAVSLWQRRGAPGEELSCPVQVLRIAASTCR